MSSHEPGSQSRCSTFSVTSFDGTRILYDLYDAPGGSTILVVPGFWRDRRHASMVSLCSWLQQLGYRTGVVDVRGHGESGGTYGFNLHEHHDVAAVARQLLRDGADGLSLVGLSYGGAISVAAAVRDGLPVRSLILISAVADAALIRPKIHPLTMHRHLAFRQAFRRPRAAWRQRRAPHTQAVDEIGQLTVPLCLVHVKNDWLVSHVHSEALFGKANEPKELHVLDIPGHYHADRIFSVAGPAIETIIEGFLRQHAL